MLRLVVCGVVLFFFLVLLILCCHLYLLNQVQVSGVRNWFGSFECGFPSLGDVVNVFSQSYFLLLVFFVVFDLEVSLLFNMPYQGEMYKNFVFYLVFLLAVLFGYVIEVKKGYISWVN